MSNQNGLLDCILLLEVTVMRKTLLLVAVAFCVGLISHSSADTASVSGVPAKTTNIVSAKSVNLQSTGDQGTISIPPQITKYAVTAVQITNCSATPILAQPAIYTGASASGTNIVAAAVITTATATTKVVNSTVVAGTLTTALTASTLYINVTVANSGALTCDFYVVLNDLS